MLAEFQASNPPHALLQFHTHTCTRSTSTESLTGQRLAKATGAQQPVYISGDEIILSSFAPSLPPAALVASPCTPPPSLCYSE